MKMFASNAVSCMVIVALPTQKRACLLFDASQREELRQLSMRQSTSQQTRNSNQATAAAAYFGEST